jgi:Flp pilus assembly protein TadB
MTPFTSFHASAVDPEQLNSITSDYLAAEQARTIRRLLVVRFAALALVMVGVGVLWLSPFALAFCVGLCVVAPIWAWVAERKYERRLARRLADLRKS